METKIMKGFVPFTVFLIVFAVVGTFSLDCPDSWVAFYGSCYYFHHTAMNFDESERYCQNHNAHLVRVDDNVENSFLLENIGHRDIGDYTGWWIGATDEDINNVWRWVDNNDMVEFNDWYPGEPNAIEGHDADCAQFYKRKSWHWDDTWCHLKKPGICELKREDEVFG